MGLSSEFEGEAASSAIGLTASAAAISVGSERHHTIPIYVCGHRSQERSLISRGVHNQLHAKLYSFKLAVNIAGRTYQTMFKKRRRGAKQAPMQQLAGSKVGRKANVQALEYFYQSSGYSNQGSMPIGQVLNREGPRFVSDKNIRQ